MNPYLRDKLLQKLETMADERGYQVLDYVEFLESRYAERQNTGSAFTRFTEAVEDKLRAGKVSASAIAETVGLMNRAANVLSGAVAATQKMATEFVSSPGKQTSAADAPASSSSSQGAGSGSNSTAAPKPTSAPTSSAQSSSSAAPSGSTATAPSEAPGASGEKL